MLKRRMEDLAAQNRRLKEAQKRNRRISYVLHMLPPPPLLLLLLLLLLLCVPPRMPGRRLLTCHLPRWLPRRSPCSESAARTAKVAVSARAAVGRRGRRGTRAQKNAEAEKIRKKLEEAVRCGVLWHRACHGALTPWG